MTQSDLSILDKQLRGINLRLIWSLIICTAVSISTVLSVYYGFKTDIAIQKLELRLIESRIDRLENAISNSNYKKTSYAGKNIQFPLAVQAHQYYGGAAVLRMATIQ